MERPVDEKHLDNDKAAISHIESKADGFDAEAYAGVAVIQIQDSRFAALNIKHKPNPLSKGLLMLYPILFVAFMNSAANGFDGNTFGGVSSVPDFQDRFGTSVAATDGFLAAIYILGKC
jgi:hypothetical protein